MEIQRHSKKSFSKKIIIPVTVLVLVLVGYGVFAWSTKAWPFSLNSTDMTDNSGPSNGSDDSATGDTSDQANKEQDAESKSAEDRIKNGGTSGQEKSTTAGSGVVDTNGSNVKKQADGVTSSSGNITLYTPTAGQKLSSSVSVTGAAKVSKVYYRISDNKHGMIANGQLKVNNGVFSGNLVVSTDASEGTFEVYSFNKQGQEVDNINVKVKY